MRLRNLVAVAFVVAAAAVVYFSLRTGPGGEPLPIWDKAQHFIAYATLSFLAGLTTGDLRRAALYAALLALAGYGIEWAQYYVGRDYDLKDELANCIGCTAGFTLSQLARLALRKRDA